MSTRKGTASLALIAGLLTFCICGSAPAGTTTGWTEYASNPVYSPLPARSYYPTILKEGSTYTMWSDDGSSNLGVATSPDGINWTTIATANGLTSPKHSLVEKIGTVYRIWYWPNLSYSINDIRTATSPDGINWAGDQAITQVGTTVIAPAMAWNRGSYGPADVLYNPAGSATIVTPVDEASVWANKYVMYYDGTTGGDESLGLAVSDDGINWHGYNSGVAPVFAGTDNPGDWDEGYVSRATVIKENDDAFHMWYSAGVGAMNHGIGYAFSSDGISWTRDPNPIFHKDDGVAWRDSRSYTPMVIGDEMWFTGKSSAGGVYSVGYATGDGGGPAIPLPATLSLILTGSAILSGFASLKRR